MSRVPSRNNAASAAPRSSTLKRLEQPHYSGDIRDVAPLADSPAQPNIPVMSHVLGNAPDVVASAVDETELVGALRHKQWRVLADKRVSHNKQIFTLRAGKEIDESNYDIANLRKQGVKLEAVEALPSEDQLG